MPELKKLQFPSINPFSLKCVHHLVLITFTANLKYPEMPFGDCWPDVTYIRPDVALAGSRKLSLVLKPRIERLQWCNGQQRYVPWEE